MFSAGEISGKLTLDKSGFSSTLQSSVEEAVKASEKLTDTLGQPFAPAAEEAEKLGEELHQVAQHVTEITKAADQNASAWSSLSQVWATAGGTLLGSAIGGAVDMLGELGGELEDVAEKSIKLAADFESTSLSFKVMIGDAGEAASLISDLRAFANTTPFQFPELANAGRQLLAMGIDAKDVVSDLRMIGDVSRGCYALIVRIARA